MALPFIQYSVDIIKRVQDVLFESVLINSLSL